MDYYYFTYSIKNDSIFEILIIIMRFSHTSLNLFFNYNLYTYAFVHLYHFSLIFVFFLEVKKIFFSLPLFIYTVWHGCKKDIAVWYDSCKGTDMSPSTGNIKSYINYICIFCVLCNNTDYYCVLWIVWIQLTKKTASNVTLSHNQT